MADATVYEFTRGAVRADAETVIEGAVRNAQLALRVTGGRELDAVQRKCVVDSVASAWDAWRVPPSIDAEMQRLLIRVLFDRVEFEVRMFRDDFKWPVLPDEGQ